MEDSLTTYRIRRLITMENWILFLLLLAASSLFWSTWLLGLCNMLFILTAITYYFKMRSAVSRRQEFLKDIQSPFNFTLVLIFGAVLVTAAFHSEWARHMDKALLMLPYLVLPIAFSLFGELRRQTILVFIIGYVSITFLFAAGVFIGYLISPVDYIEKISQGQAIRTPSSHIRFSMLVAVAVVLSLITVHSGLFRLVKPQKTILILLGSILFVFLHFLAVKTGLLTLYLAIIGYLSLQAICRKSYRGLLWAVLLIISSALISYQIFPSFKAKIHYSIWDISQYGQEDNAYLSDTYRLKSMVYGIETFKSSPVRGVGYHRLDDETRQVYLRHEESAESVKLPHNSFIYILAASGLIGAILSFPGIILPFFRKRFDVNPYLLPIGIILWISCIVEPTLETTIGIHFHLLFVLILGQLNISQQHQENDFS